MGKYLDFYKKCMEDGRLPELPSAPVTGGLCGSGVGREFKELFYPTEYDFDELTREGRDTTYWASGMTPTQVLKIGAEYRFTALRQNIVLLLAAMNDEL